MSVVAQVARQVVFKVGQQVVVMVVAATAEAVVKRMTQGDKDTDGHGLVAA